MTTRTLSSRWSSMCRLGVIVLCAVTVAQADLNVQISADMQLDYNNHNFCEDTTVTDIFQNVTIYFRDVIDHIFCSTALCKNKITVQTGKCGMQGNKVHQNLSADIAVSCLRTNQTITVEELVQNLLKPFENLSTDSYKNANTSRPTGLSAAKFKSSCPEQSPCFAINYTCDSAAMSQAAADTGGSTSPAVIAGATVGGLAALGALAGGAIVLRKLKKSKQVGSMTSIQDLFPQAPQVPSDKTQNIRFTRRF